MREYFEFKLAFNADGDPCYRKPAGGGPPEPDVENADQVVVVRLRRPLGDDTLAISKLETTDPYEGQAQMLDRLIYSVEGWKGGGEKLKRAAMQELRSMPVWAYLHAAMQASKLVGGEFEKLGESVPPVDTSSA